MALTQAQQQAMDELKAVVEEARVVALETSPTMKSLFGSYSFDLFKTLEKKIKAVEEA